MHRFFLPQADFTKETVTLTDKKELHHLKNVLRLKAKDQIAVFNNEGREATGAITDLNADSVTIRLDKIKVMEPKTVSLVLACAIPKKAKFETILEKCTELGVDEIIPLKTQRTEVTLHAERHEKKLKRYQTVVINAAKQSQRSTIPTIHPVTNFLDALQRFITEETLALIPCLFGERKSIFDALAQRQKPYKKILFFIGPEGDFTLQEIEEAAKKGCVPVSLGNQVLKVDTAAISVVAFANLFLSHAE